MNEVTPGRYRHYKGNEYTVIGTARHSETLEEQIVYRQEYGEHGLWVRPKQMFSEMVTVDGREVPIESRLNLGPKSGQWLREEGITTIAELERLGPVIAYRLVKQRQPKASLNLLWALAAGLKGKDWRELTEATKKRLRKLAEEE
jgi:hypothetical protein